MVSIEQKTAYSLTHSDLKAKRSKGRELVSDIWHRAHNQVPLEANAVEGSTVGDELLDKCKKRVELGPGVLKIVSAPSKH